MGVWTPGPGATPFDDTFTGDATNETADGLGGDDTMNGAAGDDSLSGGDDNDEIFGDQGDDALDGGSGDDVVRGNDGSDTLRGGEGADSLAGFIISAGDDDFGVFDALYGEEGDDHLYGGLQDLYGGGEGVDTAHVHGRSPYDAPENLTLDLSVRDAGGDLSLPGGGVVLSNVENLDFYFSDFFWDQFGLQFNKDVWTVIGSSRGEHVSTSGGADTLHGAGGDDFLYGAFGDDEIHGDDGDDYLSGGPGFDALFGGAGNDTLNPVEGPSPIAPVDLWTNTLDGGDGDDLIYAEPGDVISGGAGVDRVTFLLNGRFSLDLRGLTFSGGVFEGSFSGENELGSGVVLNGSMSE